MLGQVEGDVDDHVLLAADEPAPTALEQDVADVDAVASDGDLGVAQEAGVDAGVAEGERLPVDADGTVLQGADEVVGGVLEGEQVAAVLPALRSATAMNGSIGQLPAPAPWPASEASTR